MRAYIYIENGIFLEANSFGTTGTFDAELVFNTSMSGYQEMISDPSYAGQFIVFSMPEIGVVGTNEDDNESKKAHCAGIIVRELSKSYSNQRAKKSLRKYLEKQGVIALCDVDTRKLVKLIRDEGNLRAIISTEYSDKNELKTRLLKAAKIDEVNYVAKVSTKEKYVFDKGGWDGKEYAKAECEKAVGVIDYGVKKNILCELAAHGMRPHVYPYDVKADELLRDFKAGVIQGVFLSNGPGEPKILQNEIKEIKKLVEAKVPIFGLCLGHQLLSNAFGYETYKMKFGQHGSNHPVINLEKNIVEITAQNHNYNVPEDLGEVAFITHRNLFGNNVEGVRYKDYPIISVQHHPESSAGPHESKYIFEEFFKML